MRFSKWLLSIALVFSVQAVNIQAQNSCDPCDPCICTPVDLCDVDFCEMEHSAYVDFLWWQVCRSDLDYSHDGDTKYINPDYDAGWRIGFVSSYKCWDFGLRYTSFDSCNSRDDNDYDFDFDNLDIEVGYTCCLDCINGYIRPFAGAKLVWIDEDQDIASSDEDLDYSGYGLYLGCSGKYHLCDFCMCDTNIPIDFVCRASTGILHSDFDHGGDFKDECLYVNVHELYAGLEFTFEDMCGCWDTYVQLGYEVQKFGEWRELESNDDIASLGFGGLTLRFGASF